MPCKKLNLGKTSVLTLLFRVVSTDQYPLLLFPERYEEKMAHDIGQQPDVASYNRWLDYNDPVGHAVPATAAEIEEHYRCQPYVPAARDVPRRSILQGPLAPIFPPPPLNPAQHGLSLAKFLDENGNPPAELEPPNRKHLIANWRGRKILGEGNHGIVALFEYDPLAPDQPKEKKVVVKQLHDVVMQDLVSEALFMAECRHFSFSNHIVRLITATDTIEDGLRRIVMEYYPQGSIHGLLDRRISRNLPFQEITLWRIFECLVDACSVLEFGRELTLSIDPEDHTAIANPVPDWDVLVHSDIKPDNFVLGNRNRTHTETPVCKLTDFGSASRLEEELDIQMLDERNMEMREFGTLGYFTPEQFTPRWNYEHWRETEIAGVYGSATNIWGIGAIMYQLACLDENPPKHLYPFTPDYEINGEAAKGDTYGFDIEASNYSNTLKHLILECLYEKPAHRCNLKDMKYIINKAIDTIIEKDGIDGDDWVDLELPQPGGPAMYPRPLVAPAPPPPPPPPPPPAPPAAPPVGAPPPAAALVPIPAVAPVSSVSTSILMVIQELDSSAST
ncbi:kinase-like protein [Cadophora sp. DSE1049]|nr:kinase-like protein [Cadophora sp. DSE1049]